MAESRYLLELLAASGLFPAGADVRDVPITQVTDDSRSVVKGALFVALRGAQADGHRYLKEAIRAGARAVLVEEDASLPDSVVKITVPSTRPMLGPLLSAFLGFPSKGVRVIGVTGTKGKTTVTWLIQHLLEACGIPCGLIGTVLHRVGRAEFPSGNTTPGAVFLQSMLRQMEEKGCQACAMEVSSHALEQHRTDGIEWACGVFTNLSPEHLDYHGTEEEYLRAKLRLFEGLKAGARAILNQDDPCSDRVRQVLSVPAVTYGFHHPADWMASQISTSLKETRCLLTTPEGSFPVSWGLMGDYNVENLMAALAAVWSLGISVDRLLPHVESFEGVPGRLERLDHGQPFPVFVDYAHTDVSLRRVLTELRRATRRKILVVFGCGGDRDRLKRPRMGRAAAELADQVIVTSDNPRSEDPEEIIREITAGMANSSTRWEVILDRRQAIQKALESAGPRSLVLIAGKGHENTQAFKDHLISFDDRVVVKEILCGVSA